MLLIALASLIGAITAFALFQLSWNVAHNPNDGVVSDAAGLLPIFGIPVVAPALLAIVGRALLKTRR